jgi:DNA-binding protein H-NS
VPQVIVGSFDIIQGQVAQGGADATARGVPQGGGALWRAAGEGFWARPARLLDLLLSERVRTVEFPLETMRMSDEFARLSDPEILSLIHRAQNELQRRQNSHKEKLKAEIEQKLESLGIDLTDLFPEVDGKAARQGKAADRAPRAVLAKFKNHVSGETWSGRGAHPPQWVKAILAERGWTIEEFKASDEFQI